MSSPAKHLPVAVDGLEGEGRGVESVDTHVGSAAGMGAPAQELNVLDYVTVAGATDGELVVTHIAGGMAHHGHVHVIKFAEADKLLLPAHKLKLSFLPQLQSPGYFDKFFGRHCERHQLAAQFREDFGLRQAADCAQHHTDLAVVTAGVGGAGFLVGVGMFVNYERVQLPNNRHPGARPPTGGNMALNAGHSQATPVTNAHFVKLVGNKLGSLILAEAGLRVIQNLARNTDKFVAVPVNGGASPLLQFFSS